MAQSHLYVAHVFPVAVCFECRSAPLCQVNFDVDFVTPSCLFNWSYEVSFHMTMLLPLITIAIMIIRHKCFGTSREKSISLVSSVSRKARP